MSKVDTRRNGPSSALERLLTPSLRANRSGRVATSLSRASENTKENVQMSQLTVQLDENAEVAIEELKKLLGTRSAGAAVRIALALARHVAPTSKDRTVIVKDQNHEGEEIRIVLAT